jgi:uncharacterized membrane protein YukC
MNKHLFKKIAVSILGVLVLFSGILVYHIYVVTQKQNDFRTSRQLSRIDFTQPIDSIEATQLRYFVAQLPGVESTYFNYANNILVYTYFPEKQSSEAVYAAVMKQGKYTAQKYIVSETDLTKGCPAIGKNSFSYRLTSLFN